MLATFEPIARAAAKQGSVQSPALLDYIYPHALMLSSHFEPPRAIVNQIQRRWGVRKSLLEEAARTVCLIDGLWLPSISYVAMSAAWNHAEQAGIKTLGEAQAWIFAATIVESDPVGYSIAGEEFLLEPDAIGLMLQAVVAAQASALEAELQGTAEEAQHELEAMYGEALHTSLGLARSRHRRVIAGSVRKLRNRVMARRLDQLAGTRLAQPAAKAWANLRDFWEREYRAEREWRDATTAAEEDLQARGFGRGTKARARLDRLFVVDEED